MLVVHMLLLLLLLIVYMLLVLLTHVIHSNWVMAGRVVMVKNLVMVVV